MQAELAAKVVTCPFCSGPALPAPGGFLEMGEYNETTQEYATEGTVYGYQCQNGHGFYAWPDGKAVTGEDLLSPVPQDAEPKETTSAQITLPILFVAVVARGGIIERVSVHLREHVAVSVLDLAVASDFDPETDDARVFKVGPAGSEDVYSYPSE